MKTRFFTKSMIAFAMLSTTVSAAIQPVSMKPLNDVITPSSLKSSVRNDTNLPQITWAEDMRIVHANGDSQTTQKSSIFDQYNLDFKLKLTDSVTSQVEDYISGKTPYFRGTLSQVSQLNSLVYDDPSLRPVVVSLLSYSKGGDSLVVSSGVKDVKDLKGKKIALMAYGPHVYFMWRTLKSAGLTFSDVDIVWTKDLTGSSQAPAAAFCDSSLGVDAAFMVSPDASGVIEGDNACKGAKEMFSTSQASNVILDVYAVRSDYLEQNQSKVQKFVHSQFVAKEATDDLFKDQKNPKFTKWMKGSAEQLLGDQDLIEDVKAMFQYDVKHAGFSENVKFFTDARYGRNFERVTEEINDALMDMNLIHTKHELTKVSWDWGQLKTGLSHADAVAVPAFKQAQVKKIVQQMQANDTLDSEKFLSEEVSFAAGESTFVFNPQYHKEIFDKVIDEAVTYDNTLIIIEAHSDPAHYLIEKIKYKRPEKTLKRIRQKAWNLSIERAKEVRNAIVEYARDVRQIDIDESQFDSIGYGIEKPLTGICGSEPCKVNLKYNAAKKAYASNRRAVIGFTRIQAEAELSDDDFDF